MLILFNITGVKAFAYDCLVDGIYFNISNETYEATVTYKKRTEISYRNYIYESDYLGSLVIPSSISYNGKSYTVTTIGAYAFNQCKNLTSVTIPSSIKRVEFVGEGCTGLSKIIVSDIAAWCNIDFGVYGPSAIGSEYYQNNLTRYAHHLFSDENTEITSLVIPSTVTSISDLAFESCSSLTSITLPNGLVEIGDGAFQGCSKLSSISIPNSIKKIGYCAFQGCGLQKVIVQDIAAWCSINFNGYYYGRDLGGNPLSIAQHLYADEENEITDLQIPNGVTTISNYAFQGCIGLKSISIPNSLQHIGKRAFYGCTGLTSLNIPSCVTSIEDCAFYGCTGLTSLNIPSRVTSIKDCAFWECGELNNVSIAANLRVLRNNSFYKCKINNLHLQMDSIMSIENKFGCLIKECTLEDSVKVIEDEAFKDCKGMEQITFGKGIQKIGKDAFQGCDSLERVVVDIVSWCGVQLYNETANPFYYAHHLYSDNGSETTNLIIPNGVTTISHYAFYGCSGLTSVMFPSGLTDIGNYAFYGCSNLSINSIPNSVSNVYSTSFSGCIITQPLYSLYCFVYLPRDYHGAYSIPSGIGIIIPNAFNGCANLTSIEVPNSVVSIYNNAFSGCNTLKTVILNSNEFISKDRSRSYDYNEKVYVYDSFKNVFGNQVEHYEIADSVRTIGKYTFADCAEMKSIKISKNVTSVGENAFSGCSGLTKVIVPDIAAWCNIQFKTYSSYYTNPIFCAHHIFSDEDSEIKELVIPDGVTSINNYAFCGCSGLTSVIIPNSITAIYGYAFSGCSGLEKIIIPDNVVYANSTSFDKSTKLYVNSNKGSLLTLWNAGYTPYLMGTEQLLEPPYLSILSTTQTTAVLGLNSEYTAYDYYIDYKHYYDGTIDGTIFSDKELELTNLVPDTEYSKTLTVAMKNGDNLFSYQSPSPTTFTTQSMEPSLEFSNTATSYSVNGKYTKGNANVIKEEIAVCYKKRVRADRISREPKSPFWRDPKSMTYNYDNIYYDYYFQTDGSKSYDGNVRSIYHLEPNTNMKDSCLVYRITIEYDDLSRDSSTAVAIYPHTLPLELTTLQPRVATPGNVIVAAQSNIDDSETNVGFEWRRTDWTDDFPSNSGQAYLYEGGMEGYIRNLNTEKLWKYRPYFESAAGNRYYGEWMGLDPTNTSYFEPTVHTYASVNVEGNTANVQGYAMRGSDNTAQQGFKYWEVMTSSRAMAPGTGSVPSNAQTVTANGIVMQASLTNLDYETTYCYVAFVTTTEGETFYGDMRQFTTDINPTGIKASVADKAVAIPVAYYDLNGRRLQTPQSGLVIARMSDGTTRKIIVK